MPWRTIGPASRRASFATSVTTTCRATASNGLPLLSRNGLVGVPEYTRPATWEDVKKLARYFEEAGVDYAIIGGYALAAHGLARFTEDVDVLVDPSAANSRRWIIALSRLPDGAARELANEPDVFAQQCYAIRINDEITVDILASAAEYRGASSSSTSSSAISTAYA